PCPPTSPLFPYTTLFRSGDVRIAGFGDRHARTPAEDEPGAQARGRDRAQRPAPPQIPSPRRCRRGLPRLNRRDRLSLRAGLIVGTRGPVLRLSRRRPTPALRAAGTAAAGTRIDVLLLRADALAPP